MRCEFCARYCDIKEGSVGFCGINANVDGKIVCLAYGHPSAINIDPIEKKPLYHFLPQSKSFSLGTVGCNYRCSFCQNYTISQTANIDRTNYFSPSDIVTLAKQHNCQSIAFTYNEPTIFFPYAKDIALLGKEQGLKSVFVSNGSMSKEVAQEMVGLIDAINIDIKSFNPTYYKKKLKGSLDVVLKNATFLKQHGLWVEVTTLLVPTHNDSSEEIRSVASFIAKELGFDTPWHISAFHPDYKELELPRTSNEVLLKAYKIAKEEGLKYVYVGNTTLSFDTVCSCGNVLIKRQNFYAKVVGMKEGRCKVCSKQIAGVWQ